MTPLLFERHYAAEWSELEKLLEQLRTSGRKRGDATVSARRIAELYRRACEQLALARARAYPTHLVERLEVLTHQAHQAIYSRRDYGLKALVELLFTRFPQAVRRLAPYVWVALLVFGVPTLAIGALVYQRPDLILTVVDAQTAESFEEMYSSAAESIGRTRDAESDWIMFGFYVRNNMTVALQCFAGGFVAGLGTLFYLAWNGAFGGAVGGYLTERGLGETFYSFIATHAAFELTAIVLAGAAGLRIGHSIIAPGRRTRRASLVEASKESIEVVYGVLALLLIAAVIEAFWSSAQWIPPLVKYGVAALCWIAVISWLTLQGRAPPVERA